MEHTEILQYIWPQQVHVYVVLPAPNICLLLHVDLTSSQTGHEGQMTVLSSGGSERAAADQ